MSLRSKLLLAAVASVLVPVAGYLVADTVRTRSILLRGQAGSLRRTAGLVDVSLRSCAEGCDRPAQALISRLARSHPELEVMLLDRDSVVVAATRDALRGAPWHEDGITRVLRGQVSFAWATMQHHGEPVLDVMVPWLGPEGEQRGAIHLARSLPEVREQVHAVQVRHALFVVLVALAVGACLGLLAWWLVVRRLTRLHRGLGRPDRLRRLAGAPASGDELDQLGVALGRLLADREAAAGELKDALLARGRLLRRVESFNDELTQEVERTRQELLVAHEELLRRERLSTIGQLSAGLAHEVRNPLLIIRGTAERLGRQHPETAAAGRDIVEEVDRVDDLIRRLLDLGRPLEVELQPIEVKALLADVVERAGRGLPDDHGVTLELDCPDGCSTRGDAALLRQAFANLVDNACAVAGPSGKVSVRACPDQEGGVLVEVGDDGAGIAPDDLPRIFEPFFTRKHQGTGLGLCATKKVLDLHGAGIEVDSAPGEGTRVRVRLPAQAPSDTGPAHTS